MAKRMSLLSARMGVEERDDIAEEVLTMRDPVTARK